MTTPTIPGFRYETVRPRPGGPALHVALGGSGPPVLLVHGFPQTHLAWRAVAPALAEAGRTVVCPDLPGYGDSEPPPDGRADGAGGAAGSKRSTARAMVELMAALGHDRFAVAGHDRGALVAFRTALDHPAAVTRLAVLDVVPQLDMYAALLGAGAEAVAFAPHLFWLAQPPGPAERLAGADPEAFAGPFLDQAQVPDAIPPDVRAAYVEATGRAASVAAICADYRAGVFVDQHHDAADRAAGRRVGCPALALWQDPGGTPLPFDPAEVWARWCPDLRTGVLACGHYLPEERPAEVVRALTDLLDAPPAD